MALSKSISASTALFGNLSKLSNSACRLKLLKASNVAGARVFCNSASNRQFFSKPGDLETRSDQLRGSNAVNRKYVTQILPKEKETINSNTDEALNWVENVADRRMLLLKWQNGEDMLFPYLFLRDSCQCEKCFHPFTKARLILMRDLKVDAYPTKVQVDNDNGKLVITWDDGHVSPFGYSWLKSHAFNDEAAQKQDNLLYRKPTLWGTEFQDKYPTANFDQLMKDDEALYQWLTNIEEFGFCLIRNAPTQPGELERFTERISFHRTTHYGPTFNVIANPKPSNLAYTSGTLGLHTDIPYDRHPPGVQFLHCIKQTECEGGENEFSDSFYAAEILRQKYSEYYNLLCTQPINYIDVGVDHYGDFHKMSRHSIFTRDVEGNVVATQCSNQTRDSFMKQPVGQVESMIRALRKLDDILYENHIRIKMEDGDIASFGNRRVLHGRASYTIQAGAKQQRYLQGTYIDLDEVNSKRRILKKKLNVDLYQH